MGLGTLNAHLTTCAGLYEGLILVAGLLPDAESVVAVMGITFNTCAGPIAIAEQLPVQHALCHE